MEHQQELPKFGNPIRENYFYLMTDKISNEKTQRDYLITQAQSDMCKSYGNGSIGILSSGLVWLISSIVAFKISDKQSVWTLLIGGVFIHPLSILLSKVVGLSGTHSKENPLGKLAMEGTIFMLMCLPLAFGLSLQKSEWFFQGMLLIIGGRYLTFSSIYGKKIYWILGSIIGIAAYFLFSFKIRSSFSALTGSVIEISFGLIMFILFRREKFNNDIS